MPSERHKLIAMLNPAALLRLAGERSYARGVDYHAEGRVADPAEYQGAIVASVHGTEDYTVRLWAEGGRVHHLCTCPMGDDGLFCKHCVAVALEVTEARGRRRSRKGRRRELTLDDVRLHLARQDKEVLVELLMEHALAEPGLRRQLLLRAAQDRPEGPDLGTFYAALDEAIGRVDFVPYQEAHTYMMGIRAVLTSVYGLITGGHAAAALELIAYALPKVEDATEVVDDSDGGMGEIVSELAEMHHEACVEVRPDPQALAETLFAWEADRDWDAFAGAARMYADVLGEVGLARHRELAEAEWAKLKPLGPGQDSDSKWGRRRRITNIMGDFAIRAGDLEARIAVMAHDLSTGYDFLRIAKVCRDAGRGDLAREWAERGVAAFPKHTDPRLREFLADEYHGLGRHEEAMGLIWTQFCELPGLGGYQLLRQHADRCGQWSAWREKALARVREQVAREKAMAEKRRPQWYADLADSSSVVEILLWEGKVEAAWLEAKSGGCRAHLWRQLAEAREQDHPEDALPIYHAAVEPALRRLNHDGYAEATELLVRIHTLMARLDREAGFQQYLASVRVAHRRKRNFLKLLDATRELRE